MAGEKFSRVEQPKLFGREGIPQTREEPNHHANLHAPETEVVPVPGIHRHLLLPEIAERFTREEADDDDEHDRLTQQADARLVDLRRVDVEVLAAAGRCHAVVIHETTADLEKDFDAVDEKEDDDNEEENSVAAVENTVQGVFVAEEFGGENLCGGRGS